MVKTEVFLAKPPKEVGYLVHEPTHTSISVFKRIDPFRRLMIRLCFNLKYEELK